MKSLADRIMALEYYVLALTLAAENATPGTADRIAAHAHQFADKLSDPFPGAARELRGLADSYTGGLGLPANE